MTGCCNGGCALAAAPFCSSVRTNDLRMGLLSKGLFDPEMSGLRRLYQAAKALTSKTQTSRMPQGMLLKKFNWPDA